MPVRRAISLLLFTTVPVASALLAQTPEPGVLPGQKQVQVRLEQPSRTLSAGDVKGAVAGALAAWNTALPADLKLVEAPSGSAFPAGEVVILIRFDNDPAHFGTGGIDEIGDTRMLVDRAKDNVVTAVFLVDRPGSFSVNGATGTRDLQLVIMHELGHALGLQHDQRGAADQTIMSPALDENGKLLARTRKALAALRQVSAEDKDLLEIAMLKRKSRDVAGSYTGSLKIASVVSGTGTIPLNTPTSVKDGEFVVSYETGKVVLVYKGSRRELPMVDLFRNNVKLDFNSVADGRPLTTITISRGNTPDEIVVDAEIKPSAATYQITGRLTRK